MYGTDDWPLAEIISIRDVNGLTMFYVHYVDFNKRLDGWVIEEFLDTRKVQFPRKDGTTTGQNTGVTTPKKLMLNMSAAILPNLSRPTSPVSSNEQLVNGSAVLAAALQKKNNRKRKVGQATFSPTMSNDFTNFLFLPPSPPVDFYCTRATEGSSAR